MHLILTGASGLVGAACLDYMLNDRAITKITIISRGPIRQAQGHSKVEVIIQEDLATYDEKTLKKLEGAVGCVWAVGPSVMAVSKKDFIYGTRDLPIAAAKQLCKVNPAFKFVYVSHDGIDQIPHEKRPFLYKIKGEAEDLLLELPRTEPDLIVYILRPAAIDYKYHPSLKPWIKKPLPMPKKFVRLMMPMMRKWYPDHVMQSQDLGRALAVVAAGDGKPIEVDGSARDGYALGVIGMKNMLGLPTDEKKPKQSK